MNREIRAQWCAALRSGDYEQGTDALRHIYADDPDTYCCLGVLTDLYLKAGNEEEYWIDDDATVASVWDNDVLCPSVTDWAGLNNGNPWLTPEEPDGHASSLNDSGKTFAEIADLIDGGAS